MRITHEDDEYEDADIYEYNIDNNNDGDGRIFYDDYGCSKDFDDCNDSDETRTVYIGASVSTMWYTEVYRRPRRGAARDSSWRCDVYRCAVVHVLSVETVGELVHMCLTHQSGSSVKKRLG